MGIFDGYLIISDFDGTFATKTEPVEKNLPAVRYFTENGGRFTVATGRTVDFIREKNLGDLINAPACLYNGSVVYDYGKEAFLRVRHLPFSVEEMLTIMDDQLHYLQKIDVYRDCESIIHQYIPDLSREWLESKPLKILCRFETAEDADAFKAAASLRFDTEQCHLSKSWALGVEFNPPDGSKGHALEYIKSIRPGVHTAIAVGDNDNDRVLLSHADIAAAPANATPSVQELADIHLCPCTEGAIADLIRQLENKLK